MNFGLRVGAQKLKFKCSSVVVRFSLGSGGFRLPSSLDAAIPHLQAHFQTNPRKHKVELLGERLRV